MGRGRASRLAAGHWCCESRGPSVIGAPTGTNCSWLVLTRCLTRRGQAARWWRRKAANRRDACAAGRAWRRMAGPQWRAGSCGVRWLRERNVRIDAPAEPDNEFSALNCENARRFVCDLSDETNQKSQTRKLITRICAVWGSSYI